MLLFYCLLIFVLASAVSIFRSNRKFGDLINPRRRLDGKKPERPRGPTGIPRSFGD